MNQKLHLDHEVVPLEEAAEEKKTSLLADLTKLNQKMKNLDEGVEEMDKIIREIDQNVDSVEAEVQQLADLLIANIFKTLRSVTRSVGNLFGPPEKRSQTTRN